MRSRRVILHDSPNSNTRAGTYRGKTAPVPVYDWHSWRNPGGPIGPPSGDKAAGYAAAKSDNARKHADPNGRAGRNVRRQHPYAGHKHATKDPAKYQHPRQNAIRNASLQQASACTALLSRSLPHTQDKASQTKPKRTLAATFCGYPSDEEDERL